MAKSARLPSEYQEVEWIEPTCNSSNGVALESGIICESEDSEIFFDLSITSSNYLVAGGIYSYNNAGIYCGCEGGETLRNDREFVLQARTPLDRTSYKIVCENGIISVFVNNEFISMSSLRVSNNTDGFTIFNKNIYGVLGKVYGAYIKNFGELVFDAKPCYRKTDNQAGLFDVVNQRFIYNNNVPWYIGSNVN